MSLLPHEACSQERHRATRRNWLLSHMLQKQKHSHCHTLQYQDLIERTKSTLNVLLCCCFFYIFVRPTLIRASTRYNFILRKHKMRKLSCGIICHVWFIMCLCYPQSPATLICHSRLLIPSFYFLNFQL